MRTGIVWRTGECLRMVERQIQIKLGRFLLKIWKNSTKDPSHSKNDGNEKIEQQSVLYTWWKGV